MESINVVIDDDIGAQSKGEIPQSTLEALPSPTDDVSKPFSSAADHISIPHVSHIAADVPPDSTNVVPTEETDPPSNQDPKSINPLKEPASWVKLNHPSRQLLGNLNEGRRLRSRIINPPNEVANQVTYNCYLAQFEPKKVDEALQDDIGLLLCMMSCISSLVMMSRLWFPDRLITISSAPSGFSRTNQTNMAE
jgi:hypothetical protein